VLFPQIEGENLQMLSERINDCYRLAALKTPKSCAPMSITSYSRLAIQVTNNSIFNPVEFKISTDERMFLFE
jgi:hypothetical protein